MPTQTVFLHCPHPPCQATNSEQQQFCDRCGTALVKRYLWATSVELRPLDRGLEELDLGQLCGDRYLYKGNRIFLDTQPALPPHPSRDIPPGILPYLRLFPYRLHLPEPYAILNIGSGSVLLLESAPLNRAILDSSPTGSPLLPTLREQWRRSSPMRQLHWLWQIAHLWQPLKAVGVASSLLNPQLLRVQGPVVRLLELQGDGDSSPRLGHLGLLCSPWAEQSQEVIRSFLQHWVLALREGDFLSIDGAIAELDQALAYCSQGQSTHFRFATATDTGPSRSRNEDACYPQPMAQYAHSQGEDFALVMVCDGIGGHAEGEVASQQAIASILETLNAPTSAYRCPTSQRVDAITTLLDDAIRRANSVISDRNDQERRQERQRMGTTLVMAVVPPPQDQAHEIYIAHVGDSRIYWVTATGGCYQVTLDDDLASREVRLGYSLYRDALQNRSAGALVQALGMGESSLLHPSVGRLILDEDGILLLCSDGLSDGDRVEHHWPTKLYPILAGNLEIETATTALVELANTRNGHDNVTVGLIHYQVRPHTAPLKPLTQLFKPPAVKATAPTNAESMATQRIAVGTPHSEESVAKRDWQQTRRLLIGIVILLVLAGTMMYVLRPLWVRSRGDSIREATPKESGQSPLPLSSPTPGAPVPGP